MKKYISVIIGIVFITAIAPTALAQFKCNPRTGMCSGDGGGLGGGRFSQCTDKYGRVVNWRFTDFEGSYERCEWGTPPRF